MQLWKNNNFNAQILKKLTDISNIFAKALMIKVFGKEIDDIVNFLN